MMLRLAFGLLWILLGIYAFFLAPPDDPNTLDLIMRLVRGDIAGINPLIVAEFNIMGVLPLLYWSLLFLDGYRQAQMGAKIPAWPFASLMMAVGAFALIPYLGLRQVPDPQVRFKTPLPWTLKIWNSVWTGRILALAALGLLGYGFAQGDWADFVRQWQTSRFIHVMSLDYVLLVVLMPYLISEDQVGRSPSPVPDWVISWIPLLGSLAYLSLRPPIIEDLRTEAGNS